jgi:hypothetical protein
VNSEQVGIKSEIVPVNNGTILNNRLIFQRIYSINKLGLLFNYVDIINERINKQMEYLINDYF